MAAIVEHVYFQGKEENIRGLLREYSEAGNLALVLAEDGCLQFEFFFSASNPNRAVLLEHWSSAADLENHHSTAMMQALLDLVQKYEISLAVDQYKV